MPSSSWRHGRKRCERSQSGFAGPGMSVGLNAEGQGSSDGVGGHGAGQASGTHGLKNKTTVCLLVTNHRSQSHSGTIVSHTAQERFPRIPVDGER